MIAYRLRLRLHPGTLRSTCSHLKRRVMEGWKGMLKRRKPGRTLHPPECGCAPLSRTYTNPPLTRASARACTLSARVACCMGPSIPRVKAAILVEQFVSTQYNVLGEKTRDRLGHLMPSIASRRVTCAGRIGCKMVCIALAVDFAVCL